MKKPVVSYYKGNDPTRDMNQWIDKMTEVNIIRTKVITDEFIDFCITNKHRVYLHIVINGQGHSVLEKNIPTVKWTFVMIAKLIERGFPQKQILVVVDPIIPNENGLKALTILLKVFTEYKILRLRHVKFNLLGYRNIGNVGPKEPINEHIIKTHKAAYNKNTNKYVIANKNIVQRPEVKNFKNVLFKSDYFYQEYSRLLGNYRSIITIDTGNEALIGIRELMAFNMNNSWKNEDGTVEKIITYRDNNRSKPEVAILGRKDKVRCPNRCVLCPFKQ